MAEQRVVDPDTGGEKGRKAEQYSLVPRGPLGEVARLYGVGAEKYARNNWRRGYRWSLSVDALERHLAAFTAGEFYDEETECHHLASVVFHAFALMEFTVTHPEKDDVTPDGLEHYDAARPDVPIVEQEAEVLGLPPDEWSQYYADSLEERIDPDALEQAWPVSADPDPEYVASLPGARVLTADGLGTVTSMAPVQAADGDYVVEVLLDHEDRPYFYALSDLEVIVEHLPTEGDA